MTDKELVAKWNLRDSHYPDRQYLTASGGVGDGWVPLLDKLCEELFKLGWNGHLAQMKEKFGGLRFYADKLPKDKLEEARAAIHAAEKASYITCEDCGAPGSLRKQRPWIRTMCDPCDATWDKRRLEF